MLLAARVAFNLIAAAWLANLWPLHGAAGQANPGAAPMPAVQGVIGAFAKAPIVALADVHQDDVMAAFRLQLIRDPAFTAVGRDIAIEWGNARHQDILDRFMAGDDVPLDTLRRVWRTQANRNGIFDSPVYEELVIAARDVNRTLPASRRLRLLACDPPSGGLRGFAGSRDAYCAGVIEREVLARHRTALLVIGGGHVLRTGTSPNGTGPNVTALLDQRAPGSVFVITSRWSRNTDVLSAGWIEPAFLLLKGTTLGSDPTEFGPFEQLADGFLLLHRGHDVLPVRHP